jgi:hypothetical protein
MREASTRSLVAVVALMIAAALGFTLLTAPFTKLLGADAGAVASAFHAVTAFLYLLVSTIALYLGWRLLTGRISAFADLQLLAVVMAAMSFVAIAFGNWLYVFYRAKDAGSARSYFIANAPEVHTVFFQFKAFAALDTLPLTVAAAFILWRYGSHVMTRVWLRYTVAVMLGLSFFYLVVAFGLGAAITRLRPA